MKKFVAMLCTSAAMGLNAIGGAQAWENPQPMQFAALANDYALASDAQRLATELQQRAAAFLAAYPDADPAQLEAALINILFGEDVCAPQRDASVTSARLALAHMSRDAASELLTVAAHGALSDIGKPCDTAPVVAQRDEEAPREATPSGRVNVGSLHTYVDHGGGAPDYIPQ